MAANIESGFATPFEEASRRIDEENSQDPNKIEFDGAIWPRELLYSRWLCEWVQRLAPEPSEALKLAARCQHIRRWEIPRDSFAATREGYMQWRSRLKEFHADKSGRILRETGCPSEIVGRVIELNLKKNIKSDPECQVLEDALCLVFMERQLEELAERTDETKLINALRKSWAKMSEAGRQAALGLRLPPGAAMLFRKALA